MTSKTKLTVQLPDDAISQLGDLATLLGISRTDVIRRALRTELFFATERKKGKKILLKDEGANQTQEVLIL